MDKGYYYSVEVDGGTVIIVAIHNKNGQGLLRIDFTEDADYNSVAIHNKNGQGLLPEIIYADEATEADVAIHNKNGQGLLH